MGKIIRNGIEFSGACETATAVNYDNSLSGLNAQTVQEGLDELNNNLGGLRFGADGDGNYGYYGADGSLIPFKSNFNLGNYDIEFKLVKHNNANVVNYVTDKKIVCVILNADTNSSHNVINSAMGTPSNIYASDTSGLLFDKITDYSYSFSIVSYASYINVIIITEKDEATMGMI